MAKFDFIKQYVSNNPDENRDMKHSFYPVKENEIKEAEKKLGIKFPEEILEFYKEIGYGFFHNNNGEIDRFLDPLSVAQINLKEGFYEFDPTLEYYNYKVDNKIIFFEVIEGNYLTVDLKLIDRRNSIYYNEHKVFNSLSDFIIQFNENPQLIEQIQNSF